MDKTDFRSFNLTDDIMNSIKKLGFSEPTAIQSLTIPVALEGKDILGTAQTGTGKTAAFGIPLAQKIASGEIECALVLAPTRELATQVMNSINKFMGKNSFNDSALLIGGEYILKQIRQLKKNPRLIVGTPGRINDHIQRGKLRLNKVGLLVLDEMDRMLDMGFSEEIEKIIEQTPKSRQTLLFSATVPKNILNNAKKYLQNPVYIKVKDTEKLNIKHVIVKVPNNEKRNELLSQLSKNSNSSIVFVSTKLSADSVAMFLTQNGYNASSIHSDLQYNKRKIVIRDFRHKKIKVLVATDIAARGLDIDHIDCVINFDLPNASCDYIHRIGRTGRAGRSGKAVSFISHSDKKKWNDIKNAIDSNDNMTLS